MADWNPGLYRRFEEERTRPARDLLAGVPPGRARARLRPRLRPGQFDRAARPTLAQGAESSAPTTPKPCSPARASGCPACASSSADIATWRPAEAPSLIYANAALQWVGDHAALFPRLFASLAPGGVLAMQMPDNLDEPSHRAMREVASLPRYAAAIGDAASVRSRILSPSRLLRPARAASAADVDIWRTTYHHPMASPTAIVDWLRATGLRPFLDRLRRRAACRLPRRLRSAHRRRVPGARRRNAPARLSATLHRRPARRRGRPAVSASLEPGELLFDAGERRGACRSATTTPASRRG